MGQGTDGTPKLENVLECLVSDYQSYKSTASFIEWAEEFEFDTDSIKALNTYNLVKENAIKLESLLVGMDLQALQESLEEN
jgi:DNA helicase IV